MGRQRCRSVGIEGFSRRAGGAAFTGAVPNDPLSNEAANTARSKVRTRVAYGPQSSTFTSAWLSLDNEMSVIFPTSSPPTLTELPFTSWLADWRWSVYVSPPPDPNMRIATAITATTIEAIAAPLAIVIFSFVPYRESL